MLLTGGLYPCLAASKKKGQILYKDQRFSRRDFLTGTGKLAVLGGLLSLGITNLPVPEARAEQTTGINSLVWVWKFSADGELAQIRDTLAATRLGVLLKTHDGTSWMSQFDDSPDAVTGPEQIARLAAGFEDAGVPFHAWCVVKGEDPLREAEMCAEVLQSGARSLFLDLEPPEGSNYWQGTAADAVKFGEELRRRAPNAWIAVAPDSRPWQVGSVPMAEFAAFSDAIAPQAYWETFQGPANLAMFAEYGYAIGPEGVTPEVVIAASVGTFQPFGRAIHPIGQGASSPDRWRRFIAAAREHGIDSVSLWRYGGADHGAFDVLHEALPEPGSLPGMRVVERDERTAQELRSMDGSGSSTTTNEQEPAAGPSGQDAASSIARLIGDLSRVSSNLVRHIFGIYR